MSLLGFSLVLLTNAITYTLSLIPKPFTKNLMYVEIPEIGVYGSYTKGSVPFTYLILTEPGLEVTLNKNDKFQNKFLKDCLTRKLTIRVKDSAGKPFFSNKQGSNFLLILSHEVKV